MPQGTGRPWSKQPEPKGAATQIAELKDLVVGYAKQETVDPLKTLGRYLGLGFTGSVLIGSGLLLLQLALLRGLQQVAALQDPTWDWVPYLAAIVAGLVAVVLFMWRLMRFINSVSSGPAATVPITPTTSTPGGTR